MKLEEIVPGAVIRGLAPSGDVTVVASKWIGPVVEVVYRDAAGKLDQTLVLREREGSLEAVQAGNAWSFEADGELVRLATEALRIRLAYLFDPYLAVHTSNVIPLPHQITAVYAELLQRHPRLRYLLADDPGAGKTIMAGLFIKELILRGDVRRCLIVTPGSLSEQWQDELLEKFGLRFTLATNDAIEASPTGNWFGENDLVIARLDKLSRDEDLQQRLKAVDWDLVIVDEAHKMSATYFGNEVKYTKRYRLGQLLAEQARHFLLMTATPHNGKEADFQLFMALLDGDRYEGKFRDGTHTSDPSDLMRRMVKERLVTFENKPLFPERRAYTVDYQLSEAEAALYAAVTKYVQEQFNRAENLNNDGRVRTVGFALTILQRRLASSPEAIYQSLRRRRERLEDRLREEKLKKRGADALIDPGPVIDLDPDDFEDETPTDAVEEAEEGVVDQATAARTIAELEAEIGHLRQLEAQALAVRRSGTDRKWEELSRLLHDNEEMVDTQGHRRKLVLFTEHRDTLNYLLERIRTLIGRPEAVLAIHGGMGREERRAFQARFTQEKDTLVLVATDAAGEGINLQRAHLMVNYDLPWNPNRIEQRFGRIHRIGQTEVCHLWNLVAGETREGAVLQTLCRKIEEEAKALSGQIFDVLGKAFRDKSLRDLLVEAIRYGDDPEVRLRLTREVGEALDRDKLQALVSEKALAGNALSAGRIEEIRLEMERAEARKLQPHHVGPFFIEALRRLGGTVRQREPRRHEVTHVPSSVRQRDRVIGTREPVLARYERITFEKGLVAPVGLPRAEFVCPGHPLLDSTLDVVLEQNRGLLRQGGILVDDADPGTWLRALVPLEHSILDGRSDKKGERRVTSRELHFVFVADDGTASKGGWAPHLNLRAPTPEERRVLEPVIAASSLRTGVEDRAVTYAVSELVKAHLERVQARVDALCDKTLSEVNDRLTKEIHYLDRRAQDLKALEDAGRKPRQSWQYLQRKMEELTQRLIERRAEIDQERKLSPQPPVVMGGMLVVPGGLLRALAPAETPPSRDQTVETAEVEWIAMEAVMAAERTLGHHPKDVSAAKCGWDVESKPGNGGPLRLLEVKGRVAGATTVTVTRNEIMAGLNSPEAFILAVVVVSDGAPKVHYVRKPFTKEPEFAAASVNFKLAHLLEHSEEPCA